jgi:hypothetical protein
VLGARCAAASGRVLLRSDHLRRVAIARANDGSRTAGSMNRPRAYGWFRTAR